MLEKIEKIVEYHDKRFNANTPTTPFKIMTRLLEEAGELAEQINHHEDEGTKKEKHGAACRKKLAAEVRDVTKN